MKNEFDLLYSVKKTESWIKAIRDLFPELYSTKEQVIKAYQVGLVTLFESQDLLAHLCPFEADYLLHISKLDKLTYETIPNTSGIQNGNNF